MAAMRRAPREFVVEGIQTTIPIHREIMANEQFAAGQVDTTFLEGRGCGRRVSCQQVVLRPQGEAGGLPYGPSSTPGERPVGQDRDRAERPAASTARPEG
ncbi:MAG: hypothetical protein U0797_23465 [Gemmataceae bacterium]